MHKETSLLDQSSSTDVIFELPKPLHAIAQRHTVHRVGSRHRAMTTQISIPLCPQERRKIDADYINVLALARPWDTDGVSPIGIRWSQTSPCNRRLVKT